MGVVLKKYAAVVHDPWNLPITFRQEGELLVGEVCLQAAVDLRKTTIGDAEKVIASMFKAEILSRTAYA